MNVPTPNDYILYYPSIEIQDETWLKSALCVWDIVYRIVPSGYSPSDSDEVTEAVEAGVLKNIVLDKKDLLGAAETFEKFCDSVVAQLPEGIEDREVSEIRIHVDKLDARVRPTLAKISRQMGAGEWLMVPAAVADAYMLFLAEEISRRRNMPKLTDSADMFTMMHYFQNDGNFQDYTYDRQSREYTTAITVETVLPGGLQSSRMSLVLDIQKALSEGRKAFRAAIAKFSEELARVEEERFATELAEAFRDELSRANAMSVKAAKDLAIETGLSMLSVGLPTALSAIGAFAGQGDPFSLSSILNAGLIGAVASLANGRKTRRRTWKSAEASYLLRLKRTFGSGDGLRMTHPNFPAIFDEFMND